MTAIFKGSKAGAGSFKQTPDNLRSNDTFEGVMGVAAGPLKGPTKGLQSITLDGTAVENATGEMNLKDFVVQIGDGDPAQWPQKINLKLGAGAAPTNVGLAFTNPNASAPGPWITKTLNNINADFIDLRFVVSQLYRQDKKGVYETTATLEIEMKPVGKTTWVNPTINTPTSTYNQTGISLANGVKGLFSKSYFNANNTWKTGTPNFAINGKTTSAAVYELRIGVPNEGVYADTGWDVRVRLRERETLDADPIYEKRSLSWESMAAVYAGVLGDHVDWKGVAWMQMYGKASDQLNGVPLVSGEWDTKIVSCPATVYNPTTRQYTGAVWDGSWQKAFTTDPAWIINDALTDPLSGVSLVAPGSYLNKWDALDVSKWCSALVPDGNGGTHPRYNMNIAINDPSKAEEFIRFLAGAVGGLAWDQGDGQWRMKVDKPESPVDLFTLETIEGEFVYSHTDVDTRYNDITVQFKNADMMYRQDAVRLFDNASIAKIGRKPITIVAVGCTNRQEAMRRGLLRLRSTVRETRVVNFTTNRRGRNVDMLDTILVADGDLGDKAKRTTGRVVAISADRKTITVRDPMRLEVGINYTLNFSVANANYVPETTTQPGSATWKMPTIVTSRSVTNAAGARGNVTVLTLDAALPADLPDFLSVALSATDLVTLPKTYRVTNVIPADDGERISISALEVDVGKWDASDNVSKSDTVFQDLRGAVPVPIQPTTSTFLSVVKVPVEQGYQANLVVNWIRPAGAFISGFQVSYTLNGGARKIAVENLQQSTYEFVNPEPGTYYIEVRTMDRRGGLSNPLFGTIAVSQDQLTATDVKYADQTPIEALKPAVLGADKTVDALPGAWTAFTGRSPTQVVTDLQSVVDTLPLEMMRAATWRGEADQIIYLADGTPVRTAVQAIGSTVNGHQAYVAFLQKVSGDGSAQFMLTANGDGNIVGIQGLAGSQGGAAVNQLSFVASRFLFVDNSGANPINALSYSNGVWKMQSVEIDTLKVGSVTVQAVAGGGQLNAASRFTASDVTIPSTETTLIETPQFLIGDGIYGSGLAVCSFVQDASSVRDSGATIRAYVDTGSGYTKVRERNQGVRTNNGDTYWALPTAFPLALSSTSPVRIKVTAQGILFAGGGNNSGSIARDITIDIIRGAR